MQTSSKAYIGCDVHKKDTCVCLVWVGEGEKIYRRDLGYVPTRRERLEQALAEWQDEYAQLWPPVAVLETGSLSVLVHDTMVPFVDQVWVVDAKRVRELRGRKAKTDKEDAFGLAELAARGLVEPLWVPPPRALGMRALMRTRRGTVRYRTSLANRLRSLASLGGHPVEQGHVWSTPNLAHLRSQQWPNLDFQRAVDSLCRQAESLTAELRILDGYVEEMFAQDHQAQLLATIPGCNRVLSLTISTEIGDIRRFRSAPALRSFSGLAPGDEESAGKKTGGGLAKHGNRHLRWAFCQLANQIGFIPADEDPLALRYHRLNNRLRHHKHRDIICKVVIASELCKVVFAMLGQGREYEKRWPAGHICLAD